MKLRNKTMENPSRLLTNSNNSGYSGGLNGKTEAQGSASHGAWIHCIKR